MTRFLVVRANTDVRVTTRKPRLRWDEVAFQINVNIPDTSGEVLGAIDVNLPEPPAVPEVI